MPASANAAADMCWLQVRPDRPFRLAVGSFIEDYNNRVEIIQRESDELHRGTPVCSPALTLRQPRTCMPLPLLQHRQRQPQGLCCVRAPQPSSGRRTRRSLGHTRQAGGTNLRAIAACGGRLPHPPRCLQLTSSAAPCTRTPHLPSSTLTRPQKWPSSQIRCGGDPRPSG